MASGKVCVGVGGWPDGGTLEWPVMFYSFHDQPLNMKSDQSFMHSPQVDLWPSQPHPAKLWHFLHTHAHMHIHAHVCTHAHRGCRLLVSMLCSAAGCVSRHHAVLSLSHMRCVQTPCSPGSDISLRHCLTPMVRACAHGSRHQNVWNQDHCFSPRPPESVFKLCQQPTCCFCNCCLKVEGRHGHDFAVTYVRYTHNMNYLKIQRLSEKLPRCSRFGDSYVFL